MARAAKVNLEIYQGRTFSETLRWGQARLSYALIQSASQAAPCVLVTQQPHGLPDGWAFTIGNARGMTDLNSVQDPVLDIPARVYEATVRDSTTIELNDVDSTDFPVYTGGGVITFNTPYDLSGFTAAAQVRASYDDPNVLLALTTIIDNTAKTITLQATAVETATIDWQGGVWDLEVTSPGGIVTPVAAGIVTVIPGVTR